MLYIIYSILRSSQEPPGAPRSCQELPYDTYGVPPEHPKRPMFHLYWFFPAFLKTHIMNMRKTGG